MKQRRSGGAQYSRFGTAPDAARFRACGHWPDRNVVQYAPRGILHTLSPPKLSDVYGFEDTQSYGKWGR